MRSDTPLLHGEITSSIIDSFFEVHGDLGFGFRECIYARALERLLIEKGHKVDQPTLEVGLVLHFGKKRVSTVFFENRFKHRNKS